MNVSTLKHWKIVTIGAHNSNDELCTALVDGSIQIAAWSSDILDKVEVATQPTEFPLVLVSGLDLGLKGKPTRKQIFDAALATGRLALCPGEVGPQLRLQYPDQPKGEWNPVAMEPIADSDGYPLLFNLGHNNDGLWLSADLGNPEIRWSASDQWILTLLS